MALHLYGVVEWSWGKDYLDMFTVLLRVQAPRAALPAEERKDDALDFW